MPFMPTETPTQNAAPFWYVYREGGDAPQCKHPSKTSAVTEADRLALAFPSAVFHVLKCVASVSATRVHWVDRDLPV